MSKAQKREIRKLEGVAYEREMADAVSKLQAEFERWRQGEMDVFELNERIHKFHDGISRELYKKYAMAGSAVEWVVASAVVNGIVKESEVDPAALEYLQRYIEFARQGRAS